MPNRNVPLDVDAIILFELYRSTGTGPELLRRVQTRMKTRTLKIPYGTWYPALKRLADRGHISSEKSPSTAKTGRIPKIYMITFAGRVEAGRIKAIIDAVVYAPAAT